MKQSVLAVFIATLFLVSCSSTEDFLSSPYEADWAAGAAEVMAEALADPAGDFELDGDGSPPYSEPVPFAPVDVRQVVFGMDQDFLYLQLNFDAKIPQAPQGVAASGEVEQQNVMAQHFDFVLDTDNDDNTGGSAGGVDGVDISFGFDAVYGQNFEAGATYGISSASFSGSGPQLLGELGAGGPGTDYVLLRFDVSGLDPGTLPHGQTVEVGGWSFAESDLYSGMTVDTLRTTSWTVPHAPVGGSGVNDNNTTFGPR